MESQARTQGAAEEAGIEESDGDISSWWAAVLVALASICIVAAFAGYHLRKQNKGHVDFKEFVTISNELEDRKNLSNSVPLYEDSKYERAAPSPLSGQSGDPRLSQFMHAVHPRDAVDSSNATSRGSNPDSAPLSWQHPAAPPTASGRSGQQSPVTGASRGTTIPGTPWMPIGSI